MTLGPFTRPLLEEAALPPTIIEGIAAGTHTWTIAAAPAIGSSADPDVALAIARDSAARKDFHLKVTRTEEIAGAEGKRPFHRRVYDRAIPNELGTRIARARRYEDELDARGAAQSELFRRGSIDDWITASSESWGALAFEFRRAADAVLGLHSEEEPAPMMAALALCRHHFELALKAVLAGGVETQRIPSFEQKHYLKKLWTQAEPIMKAATGEHWRIEEAEFTRAAIEEFETVDPDGQRTRYPVDKSFKAFDRPSTLFSFSLARFAEQFRRAADFLDESLLWIEIDKRRRRVDGP